MKFTELGLRTELLQSLEAKGYTVPTPVQAQAIPFVLEGHDILAGAQTGTGKTAAFALPMLHVLSQATLDGAGKKPRLPRALILTPTRELADQVATSFRTYGENLKLRTVVIYGGVGFNPQAEQLKRGADIIVATPGRLLDHANQGTINLAAVEIFVLDEADRMLDMGFLPDMRKVMKLLRTKRQNMLFSATYSKEIRVLAEGFLNAPKEIDVAPRNSTVELISQVVHPVAQNRKRALLSKLIKQGDWRQVLVFTRTKHGANRLAQQLNEDGVSASAIHGNKSQGARTRALAEFKTGELCVLVATDIASRGLDISQLPHVVNYELPNVPEEYVHRIGRTGRAGMEGTAVALVAREESRYLRDIEKLMKRTIEVQLIEGYDEQLIDGDGGPAPKREQRGARTPSLDSRGPRRSSPPPQHANARRKHPGGGGSRSSAGEARSERSDRTEKRFERAERPVRGERPARAERERSSGSPERQTEQRSARPERPARTEGSGFSMSRTRGKSNSSPSAAPSRPRRKRNPSE
ncbi:MAG: DEAD/DEAH box helicase [Sumerlaeia bacterium]